jgi:GDP-6-deoxy-D-talose 4-dehydrogenase
MANIFITGISGFIGSELARQMALAGHTVTGSSFTGGSKNHFKCDIRKSEEILAVIEGAQPEIVIHAAALSSVTLGRTMDYYESNVLGTENVIAAVNALGGRRRLVFISTAGVYGNQKEEVLTEDLPPLPVSHYGMSKLVCERMLANVADAHDITIIRPFNIIGAGQNKSFIVPKLVQHFAERKHSVRLGNLDPVRDYIDVQTCCNIIAQLTMAPAAYGETVNLCAGTGTSVRDLLAVLSDLTQHSIEVIPAPEFMRKSEVWRLLGGATKLHRLLPQQISPRPFKDVLAEMLTEAVSTNESVV